MYVLGLYKASFVLFIAPRTKRTRRRKRVADGHGRSLGSWPWQKKVHKGRDKFRVHEPVTSLYLSPVGFWSTFAYLQGCFLVQRQHLKDRQILKICCFVQFPYLLGSSLACQPLAFLEIYSLRAKVFNLFSLGSLPLN